MIEKITMYQAVCDSCGKTFQDHSSGIIAWDDRDGAMQMALDSEWKQFDDRLYCPDCMQYDEELDEYVPITNQLTH